MQNTKSVTASKEATSAISTTTATAGDTPQSTKKKKVNLPCALKYFFTYCVVAWGYAMEKRLRLVLNSPRFTEEFITAQVDYVKVVEQLPTLKARKNAATMANQQLASDNQKVRSMLQMLKTFIVYAYKDKVLIDAQLKASGLTDYSSQNNDWGNTDGMIRDAKQFMTNYGAKLQEGSNMPPNFPKDFETAADVFNAAWLDFIAKDKASQDGTATQEDGIEKILSELNPMMDIGYRTFEFEPAERKKFTRKDVLNEVRSKHMAGIKGTVKLSTTDKPMAGVQVEIEGVEDAVATTDKNGRFSIKVVGGNTYNVRFTAEDTEPLTVSKLVKPGVEGEVKVSLSPVLSPSEAIPTQPINEQPSTNDTLSANLEALAPIKAQENGQAVHSAA
ncbi:MAG: carboxypeptidase regulatory-like domain-containing protein [Saprospiraceae bacterium]|nr:carboxypeptidase regulatory-like domain-containing protein [Saprospiraceae bacterium]